MSATTGQDRRDVVPRWRDVIPTLRAGELPTDSRRVPDPDSLRLLAERFEAWDVERSESFAVELVGTALALGRLGEVQDALAELEAAGDNSLVSLLKGRTSLAETEDNSVGDDQGSQSHREYHAARIRRLRNGIWSDPRRALAWSELARSYMALGFRRKAEEALTVALALAPNNRYLIRNAVCFYITDGQPDQAHAVVTKAPRTPFDPWLIAAELSAAHVAGISPKHVRHARSMLQSGNNEAMDISEMASALATLEMEHGSKKAKELFTTASIAPTENSLAQIEWASHRLRGINLAPEQLAESTAAEARSLHAFYERRWNEAYNNAQAWLQDQFFSAKAAMMASYAAAVGLMDWSSSYASAMLGLEAHPRHPGLLNNAAYALVELGEYGRADTFLTRALSLITSEGSTEEGSDIAVLATAGLLAFRRGEMDRGRSLYGQAVARAHAKDDLGSEAMARLMLAREEFRRGSDDWMSSFAEAVKLEARLNAPGVRAWIERLRESITTAAGGARK